MQRQRLPTGRFDVVLVRAEKEIDHLLLSVIGNRLELIVVTAVVSAVIRAEGANDPH